MNEALSEVVDRERLPLIYIPESQLGIINCNFALLIDPVQQVAILINAGGRSLRGSNYFLRTPNLMFRVWCDCCCNVPPMEFEKINLMARVHNFVMLLMRNPSKTAIGSNVVTEDILHFFKPVNDSWPRSLQLVHKALVETDRLTHFLSC